MHFISIAAAFFAVTIPIVILLYLLKLKRVRTEISSTILWKRSIEDLMANAPFQRLRRNLLLYLQILVLLLAVLAAMRPFLRWAGRTEQNLIVLLDRSASMQSTDLSPSRLAAAKQHALKLVDDLSRGDRMTVLTFSDHAEVVQPLTDDKMALRRAIQSITPSDATTALSDSLAIARALVLHTRNAEIYIISDGGISERNLSLEDLSLPGMQEPRVSYVKVGARAENLGITELDLRQSVGRERTPELFVGLHNYSSRERKTTLRLLLDNTLLDAKDVAIGPGQSASEIFRDITARDGTVEVRLDAPDDLAVDNVARGVLHLKSKYAILLVTNESYFLERLLALHPEFNVTTAKPAAYAPGGQADLTIFDDFAPKTLAPGNYLMLNAVPPLPGVSVSSETLKSPVIVDWHRLHPLTRYANFEPVNIQKALKVKAPSWAQVLAESTDGPMIILFEDRTVRCLSTAFSARDSDWPLHVSFPIFLTNAVNWLVSQSGDDARISYHTGDTVRLAARGRKKAEIRKPDGRDVAVEFAGGAEGYFAATEQSGYYAVRAAGAGGKVVDQFAVSLLSEKESNTSPTEQLSFQGRLVRSSPERVRSNLEIWPWLAFAALVVFMGEWMIYCRRSSL
jgi:hypothetical protein